MSLFLKYQIFEFWMQNFIKSTLNPASMVSFPHFNLLEGFFTIQFQMSLIEWVIINESY